MTTERKPIQLYVLHLNPDAAGMTDRYSVMYLDQSGDLCPLWGDYMPEVDAKAGRKSAKAWPHMVYRQRPSSGPDRYPAFHFALTGYGYSKLYELAQSLAGAIGWPVDLIKVTGWRSGREHGVPLVMGTRKAALAKITAREI